MDKSKHQIAFLTGIVYFSQGALGLIGVALPIYLRNLGWSISQITAVSAFAASPWIFKIVYGFISDAYPIGGYRRKSYLIVCSIIAAIGWWWMSHLPSSMVQVSLALFVANLGFASTDVVTDGIIVENSEGEVTSFYQSIAWGTRSLGAFITGLTGGWLAERWNPDSIFRLVLILPALVCLVSLLIPEKRRTTDVFPSMIMPVKKCVKLLMDSNFKVFIVILLICSISSALGVPFFFYMKESLGFKETYLGLLTSLGWAGAAIGSFIYALWIKRFKIKTSLRLAVVLTSLNIFSALLVLGHRSALGVIFLGGIVGCISFIPMMVFSVNLTHHTQVEGTLFAMLMGIYNLGQVSWGFLGGRIYEWIGLRMLIMGTGVVVLLALYFVNQLSYREVDCETS